MKNVASYLYTGLVVLSIFAVTVRADSERKAQEIADSAKPVAVKGGEKFVVPMPTAVQL
jgi:hypothetical protein